MRPKAEDGGFTEQIRPIKNAGEQGRRVRMGWLVCRGVS